MTMTPREPGGLDRRVVVAALLAQRDDLLVVCGLGAPTYDVASLGDHDLNFYLWGAMGSAAMIGLGLALAQPARPVLVITGDGEQLMGMGALASVAVKHPANLTIAVLDNGEFGETGRQISHTGFGVSLPDVAGAVGFASSAEILDMAGVEDLRRALRANQPGPRFAAIRIEPGNPERVLPTRDGVRLKIRFRAALGV
jgi:thiamine pyrophosphate-dependent acetolactate synthase large subunit-like protein